MNPSDEIKQKMDIVDFIREYIPVKAVGANFQALCPFHGEKTPSLVISPEKQIWHCFGCGKGGDVFSFLMEMEGLAFLEAVRQLAPRVGVVLKNENPETHSKRNRLLDMMALSVKYYHHVLKTSVGEKPLAYLTKRGLTPEIISEWQIGYSPESWDSLLNFLSARPLEGKKYLASEMLEAGLVIKKEGANRFYDRFRDRIMFPINDVSGNPIAYSARLNPEVVNDKVGKYINSPQDAIYDKSRVLFGLDKAKNYIKSQDLAIVVEGQMDVIACHQFGFKNTVASSGTALTAEQVALLKRYTNNIALCFDADAAGQLAADRGIKEAMAADMNIRVIIIPSGKDPDEALRQDKDSFALAVQEAKPMMEYYFDKVTAGLDLQGVENKKEVAKKMLAMIAKLANKIEAAHWLRITAQALETDENALRESLPKESVSEAKPLAKEAPKATLKTREEQLSELILALALRFPDFLSYIISKLEPDCLENEENRSFYKNLIIYYNKTAALEYEGLKEYLNSVISGAADILDRLILLGEKDFYAYEAKDVQAEIIKTIVELKKYYFQKQIASAQKEMALAEKENDEEKIKQVLERLKVLTDLQRNNQIS